MGIRGKMGGCPATRRSTSGYCAFLGDNLLTWSSKRQDTLSRSSAEAEYRGVANAVAETSWIPQTSIHRELRTHFSHHKRPWSPTVLIYKELQLRFAFIEELYDQQFIHEDPLNIQYTKG
ncbi:ribonuclease H-like domain-containing protein [Tanacetum coccineum]